MCADKLPPRHPNQLFDKGKLPLMRDLSLEADQGSEKRKKGPQESPGAPVGSNRWIEEAQRRTPPRPSRK
jgi:hypothetical protein